MPQLGRSRFFQLRILIAVVLIALFLSSTHLVPVQAAAGDLDPTFGIGGRVTTDLFGANDAANSAVIQQDGKIIVVGNGADPNGPGGLVLVRYNIDGSLDPTFGSAGKAISATGITANSAALQPDGKVVVGGRSGFRFGLERHNSDGSLDVAFGSNGIVSTSILGFIDVINAVAIQADGKIIAVGFANTNVTFTGKPDFAIARYNIDGGLDSTFGVSGKVTTDFLALDDLAKAVAIQADGKIVVAGSALTTQNPISQLSDFAVARYNPDGSLDNGFGIAGKLHTDFHGQFDEARGVAILPNGKIIVAGIGTDPHLASLSDFGMVRYNTDGSIDPSFGSNGKVMTDFSSEGDFANSVALGPNGKIILAGFKEKGRFGDDTDFAVARYNADGSLDLNFGSGGKVTTDFFGSSNVARVALVQTDGKIVAVGTANRTDSFPSGDFALARYEGSPFDMCLQDDNGGNLLQFNTNTGDYQFTNCSGFTLGGTAVITRKGSMTTLQQNGVDRRLLARIDGGVNKGTASLQVLSQGTTFTITDRNTLNNTCSCGAPGGIVLR
jgi:uncharacterized delta-60 repeat protein